MREIIRYLCKDGNLRVPGGRYGTDTHTCAAVAAILALTIAEITGEAVDHEAADHAMAMVVNSSPEVADIINEHGRAYGFALTLD